MQLLPSIECENIHFLQIIEYSLENEELFITHLSKRKMIRKY